MAGAAAPGAIVSRAKAVEFSRAQAGDDPAIRALLRAGVMEGDVGLALTREPDYFAEARQLQPPGRQDTIVARRHGEIVCTGSCTTQLRYINGEARRVGYLGGLRLSPHAAGRSDIVRGGYRFFRSLHEEKPADFYFTSIAAGNHRALRLLERNLPGLPRYERLCDYVTLAIPVRKNAAWRSAKTASVGAMERVEFSRGEEMDEVLGGVNAGRFHLAPCWRREDLQALSPLGCAMDDFVTLREGGQMVACAALWDQRRFRQTIVHGYSRALGLARPLLNLGAKMMGHPRLPEEGAPICHAFLSHYASGGNPERILGLLRTLMPSAVRRKLDYIMIGFPAPAPDLAVLRAHFRAREYRSILFRVDWPGDRSPSIKLDPRDLRPEAALL